MTVSNSGGFGKSRPTFTDPFTGEKIRGLVYPAGSSIHYFEGTFAVGAIVGNDTLVTTVEEFAPAAFPFYEIELKSKAQGGSFFSRDARSDLDITAVFYDTLTDTSFIPKDDWDNRPHKPLGIRVIQRSMAWSSPNIDDFILIEYEIGNLGSKTLNEVFIHIGTRNQIGSFLTDSAYRGSSGFLSEWVIDEECGQLDKIDVAYSIDEDGHLGNISTLDYWEFGAPRAAVGIRVLSLPNDTIRLNYNWFTPYRSDVFAFVPESCGPRRPPPSAERLRTLGSGFA